MFRQDISPFKNFSLVRGGKTFDTEGCAICTVFSITEQESPIFFSATNIKKRIKEMYAKGYIDDEFTILGPKGWKGCFIVLGLKVKGVRYESNVNYHCRSNERESLKLVKPGYAHFVHGNGKGVYVYDSLGRRPQQKDYTLSEKRIVML